MRIEVYYNEIEPYAAQWLRNLMAEDLDHLIAQHTRAEVRKAVEPLISALEGLLHPERLPGHRRDIPMAECGLIVIKGTTEFAEKALESALSAHRARESQEGLRGPAESKTE